MARSKIAEMVEEEAAKAEAESPDEDEEEGADANPEPEGDDEAEEEAEADPEAAAEPLSMEARAEAIEALTKVHFDSLEIIFGDAWRDATNCPLCEGLGAVFPENPVMDEAVERCPVCHGHGQRFTPSLVAEHMTETCPECFGNGWRAKPLAAAPEAAPVPIQVPPMPVYNPTTNQWEVPNGNQATSYAAPAPVPGVTT